MILAVPSSALAAPTITEFTSGTGPADIVAGPDGNLWFVETSANKIGRMTPAGVLTEFSPVAGGNVAPSGIAVGADGNIWFGQRNRNRIGRITTGATPVVTEVRDYQRRGRGHCGRTGWKPLVHRAVQ